MDIIKTDEHKNNTNQNLETLVRRYNFISYSVKSIIYETRLILFVSDNGHYQE